MKKYISMDFWMNHTILLRIIIFCISAGIGLLIRYEILSTDFFSIVTSLGVAPVFALLGTSAARRAGAWPTKMSEEETWMLKFFLVFFLPLILVNFYPATPLHALVLVGILIIKSFLFGLVGVICINIFVLLFVIPLKFIFD